jgi:hypothetical protein
VSRDWGPLRYTWEHHSGRSCQNNQNLSDYMATYQCHPNKLGGDTNHLMVREEGSSD